MVVLITGIGGCLAQRVALALAAMPGVRAIGVARETAGIACPGVELVAAELRGDELLDLLGERAIETVVHLDQPGEEQPAGPGDTPRAGMRQALELMGACAARGVRRLVLRSSTHVYGAAEDTPAFVDETAPLRPSARAGLQSDYVAIERFAADFARRAPGLAIVTVRCAPLAGGGLMSPLVRYLSGPAPLTELGFNPRIQVLHPDDAAAGFALAALAEVRGPLNMAADGAPTLGQAIALAGRRPLPLPGVAFSTAALLRPATRAAIERLPFDPSFLRFSCVAETRRAREALGWLPQHSALVALGEIRAQRGEPAPQ